MFKSLIVFGLYIANDKPERLGGSKIAGWTYEFLSFQCAFWMSREDRVYRGWTLMRKQHIAARQTTLNDEVVLTGVGVHSGAPVSITLHPADAHSGIRFAISVQGRDVEIPAHCSSITCLKLCTVLGSDCGAAVATVEHLMAALRGLCIDNVLVEIDNGEVPIMDGSAMPFVRAIEEIGVKELEEPRRFIKVLKPIRVEEDGCWGELLPYNGFRLEVEIDFETPVIGRQKFASDMNPGVFREELARARTFGFMSDVETLWAHGRALGASLENTVAIGDEKVINPEGLRWQDEFVRHKALDAVGDLALAGQPLLCVYRSYRGGHSLNAKALKTLFADKDAWAMIDVPCVREPQMGEQQGAALLEAANFAPSRS